MTAASRSLATALWGARFASGLLPQSYTTTRDTTFAEGVGCVEHSGLLGPRSQRSRA